MNHIRKIIADQNRLSNIGDLMVFVLSSLAGLYLLSGMMLS